MVASPQQTPRARRVSRLHGWHRDSPPGRSSHVVLDNLNTHKKNENWLTLHPKVRFRFTPTRVSWLSQTAAAAGGSKDRPAVVSGSRPIMAIATGAQVLNCIGWWLSATAQITEAPRWLCRY